VHILPDAGGRLTEKFAPLEKPLRAGASAKTLQSAAKGKTSDLRQRVWKGSGRSCRIGVVPKPKPVRCEDCFFHQRGLCALDLGKPCTTFRPAERGLAPERQLAFVFRTARTTAAYAFPQPHA
jgi:hypothetical protein